ncbi:MAG: methylmalonyl-CoA epimerase [Pyramidobacter sp.]|uniref:methylmalonyl-CoA epimerase n=1 Tax=unclassified Pyramidobacter TaxID=2632171 RepID=UPI000EA3E5FD|nr:MULTISPECIES: methylmalonyl-CoA epimerase [unclassified Pyramidobacter]MDY4032019.1 methylmalonyl-CoA epimerase [Pyramidobacter sp.]RKJ75694.1 methylmalonyl-CoA epimerase [Pyramidobacter sp. CG50-2]
MNLTVIDHLGVAVPSIDEALAFWQDTLGVACHGVEEVADQKVKTAFLPIRDTEVELLEPTGDDSPVAKFMEKNGGRGGLHHVAIRVENLEAALAELKEKGVRLIDEKPRRGAGGAMIAFLHPKSTGGVLLELCERR